MIFLFTSGVLTDGNLRKILKMSPKVRLSTIDSHCVCCMPQVRENRFLPAPGAVRKCDQDQHTDVLSGKTLKSRFVQKNKLYKKQQNTFVKRGCSYIVSTGRGGHVAPKSTVCIPAH